MGRDWLKTLRSTSHDSLGSLIPNLRMGSSQPLIFTFFLLGWIGPVRSMRLVTISRQSYVHLACSRMSGIPVQDVADAVPRCSRCSMDALRSISLPREQKASPPDGQSGGVAGSDDVREGNTDYGLSIPGVSAGPPPICIPVSGMQVGGAARPHLPAGSNKLRASFETALCCWFGGGGTVRHSPYCPPARRPVTHLHVIVFFLR